MLFSKWVQVFIGDEIVTLFSATEVIPYPTLDASFYNILMLYDNFQSDINRNFKKVNPTIYDINTMFSSKNKLP